MSTLEGGLCSLQITCLSGYRHLCDETACGAQISRLVSSRLPRAITLIAAPAGEACKRDEQQDQDGKRRYHQSLCIHLRILLIVGLPPAPRRQMPM